MRRLSNPQNPRRRWLPAVAVAYGALVAALLACALPGVGAGPVSDRDATVQALASSVLETATAAGVSTSVATPTPTREGAPTNTPVPDDNQSVLNAAATEAAKQALELARAATTATAVAPILAELPLYGVDPAAGTVKWIHPSVTLDIEGFESYDYANRFVATVVTDFVVSTDITWNTLYGESGCGVVLRSDGNQDALNQYLVIITRAANGYAGFTVMRDGEVTSIDDMYARGIDPKFSSANDTTNRLTVKGQGTIFTIYTNGVQIGQFNDDQLDRGFVALVALNRSGNTHCAFNNTWMWAPNGQ
jgi:hypothetical protein